MPRPEVVRVRCGGRERVVTEVKDFKDSYTGMLMEIEGWEPRWYMVGKTAYIRSTATDRIYPYLQEAS